MGKARKKVRLCLLLVVLTAVVVGILYYYGQIIEGSSANEGTLISNVQMSIRRLCR